MRHGELGIRCYAMKVIKFEAKADCGGRMNINKDD
jgi:hypothetical protein